jgi:hypothetical protein
MYSATAAASSLFPAFLHISTNAVLNCLYPFSLIVPKMSRMICSCQGKRRNGVPDQTPLVCFSP